MIWTDMIHATYTNRDCEIHYWHRIGNGNKYVLFFHGACVDHRMFEQQVGIFDASYDLVFWDARGHGLSKLMPGVKFSFADMISDCRKLYEVLNISCATIIGQSMGGNLAQEMAYHYSEAVEKLVLIGCTKNTGVLTVLEKLALKFSKTIITCYPWDLLIRQIADACGNKEHVKQYVKNCFQQIDKSTCTAITMAVTKCLHEDEEYRFKQPVLLLCGADDKTGNIRKIATAWAQSDSRCTLCIIENAGHNANQDEPEIVNAHISNFLFNKSVSSPPL